MLHRIFAIQSHLTLLMPKQNHIDRNADITLSCAPVGERLVEISGSELII